MTHHQNTSYLHRLQSIDLLRGIILIIMALDHVKDYFSPLPFDALDLSQTNALWFFTRWITHLCAPTFVALSGISAYLYGKKRTRWQLSGFLFKRGLWLIFLELTVISSFWKFTLDTTMVFQVIWALGVSMIILSTLIWLPIEILLAFSLIMIFGHNLLDNFTPVSAQSFLGQTWPFIHKHFTAISFFDVHFRVVYSIIPWPGIMAFGYCLGTWFNQPVKIRSKRFFYLGISCLGIFFILRYFNSYGNPEVWVSQTRGPLYTFLSFINVTKYPPSLLFILLMLGIIFTLWPLYERWHGFGTQFILSYGKVPMFFYLIHLPIIHLGGVVYSRYFLHYPGGWWWGMTPWNSVPWPSPAQYQPSLFVVYVAWLLVILVTYPLCSMYKKYKSTHSYKWLSYL